MSAHFNQLPLSKEKRDFITTRLIESRDHVRSTIERRGNVADFVKVEKKSLEQPTRGIITAIANGTFPDALGDRMHPKATALEQGLVVGTAIAKQVLRVKSAIAFEEDFTAHLFLTHEKLHVVPSDTGYDFDQLLALTGRSMAHQLGDMPLPAKSAHTKIDADKNQLYSDAVGYVAGMATVVLCTEAMAAQNRLPNKERRAMEKEATAAQLLSPQDFGVPPHDSDSAL